MIRNRLGGGSLNEFGLYGVQVGDPGFTIAVYFVDTSDTLPAQIRAELEQLASPQFIQLSDTADGQLCLTIDCPHLGWYEAGKVGDAFVRSASTIASVHRVEVCRSDHWSPRHAPAIERIPFDTRWSTYLFTLEVVPRHISDSPASSNAQGSTDNEDEELLSRAPDRRPSHVGRTSNGNLQLTIKFTPTRFRGASIQGAKVAHGVSNQWSISRIQIWQAHD